MAANEKRRPGEAIRDRRGVDSQHENDATISRPGAARKGGFDVVLITEDMTGLCTR